MNNVLLATAMTDSFEFGFLFALGDGEIVLRVIMRLIIRSAAESGPF